MTLSERSIVNFIAKYNDCKGFSFTSIKEDLPAFSFEIGPSIGYNFWTYKNKFPGGITNNSAFSEKSLDDTYRNGNSTYGFYLTVGFPRISDRLSIRSGIRKSQLGFGGIKEATYAGDPATFTSDFQFSSLSIPFLLQYYLWKKEPLDFQLILGVEHQFFKRKKSYLHRKITFSESEYIDLYNMYDGFFGTLGVQGVYSFEGIRLGADITYNGSFSFIGHYEVTTYIKYINTSLFLRYSF